MALVYSADPSNDDDSMVAKMLTISHP